MNDTFSTQESERSLKAMCVAIILPRGFIAEGTETLVQVRVRVHRRFLIGRHKLCVHNSTNFNLHGSS